ncbi:dTDP-4-dehydrorhamnose reductase [Reinekea sp.]|uniref:dTDP-4-dehydrorhamnose reductase n=1 Tax=Reinekea sp. TaxID=1970455 RepID=UPI00257D172E|nr:dTDP-4-dehydrorhamnose reductase [Reinekea sp.]
MKVLLLGTAGQLGRCVQDALRDGPAQLVPLTRHDLDLTDPAQLRAAFDQHRPDMVINAAAYNAVDRAETEAESAHQVNAQVPAQLAQLCVSRDAYLIHFSTDYVFDGQPQMGGAPYTEQALTHPLSVYGASKLAGEQAVLTSACRASVIRTSWLFSEYGTNFVKTMLRLANAVDPIQVVTDQRGCPTYAGDLAQVVKRLVAWDSSIAGPRPTGLFHYAGDTVISWYDFAQAIVASADAHGLLRQRPTLVPIKAAEFQSPALRPAYSALDSSLLTQELGVPASDWQRALLLVLARLKADRR